VQYHGAKSSSTVKKRNELIMNLTEYPPIFNVAGLAASIFIFSLLCSV
jgi:hypothetical protein